MLNAPVHATRRASLLTRHQTLLAQLIHITTQLQHSIDLLQNFDLQSHTLYKYHTSESKSHHGRADQRATCDRHRVRGAAQDEGEARGAYPGCIAAILAEELLCRRRPLCRRRRDPGRAERRDRPRERRAALLLRSRVVQGRCRQERCAGWQGRAGGQEEEEGEKGDQGSGVKLSSQWRKDRTQCRCSCAKARVHILPAHRRRELGYL